MCVRSASAVSMYLGHRVTQCFSRFHILFFIVFMALVTVCFARFSTVQCFVKKNQKMFVFGRKHWKLSETCSDFFYCCKILVFVFLPERLKSLAKNVAKERLLIGMCTPLLAARQLCGRVVFKTCHNAVYRLCTFAKKIATWKSIAVFSGVTIDKKFHLPDFAGRSTSR